MTGSLTPVFSSPGNTVRISAPARPAGSPASSGVDPPVLAGRRRRGRRTAASVRRPSATSDGRSSDCGAERPCSSGHRLEGLAVLRARDDVRAAPLRAGPDAVGGDHIRAVVVEGGVGRAGPPADAAARRGHRDHSRRAARQRELRQGRSRYGCRPAPPHSWPRRACRPADRRSRGRRASLGGAASTCEPARLSGTRRATSWSDG